MDLDEERKDGSISNEGADEMDEISLTSNFAFDRFLSLGALGYSNGMIRLLRVGTLRDEVSVES